MIPAYAANLPARWSISPSATAPARCPKLVLARIAPMAAPGNREVVNEGDSHTVAITEATSLRSCNIIAPVFSALQSNAASMPGPDRTEKQLAKEMTWPVVEQAWIHIRQALTHSFVAAMPSNTVSPTYTEVQDYLKSCAESIRRYARNNFAGWSPNRWLFYLRRIPRTHFPDPGGDGESQWRYAQLRDCFFPVSDPMQYLWVHRAAQALALESAWCQEHAVHVPPYPVNSSVARHLARLIALARHLLRVNRDFMSSTKGCNFYFTPPYPYALWDSAGNAEARRAIALFDQRYLNDGNPNAPLGLGWLADAPDDPLIPYVTPLRPSLEDDRRYGPQVYPVTSAVRAVLADLVARNLVPTRALTSILMLLWLQGRAFEDRLFDEHSLSRYGYATVPRVDFLALVLKYFAPAVQVARRVLGQVEIPADAEDLLQWLGEAKWRIWPLSGGRPIIPFDKTLSIDLDSTWGTLLGTLEIDTSQLGAGVDVRGKLFENEVQTTIDSGSWTPPDWLRVLRGRQLQLKGATTWFTDLDAVGFKNGVLLAIDCKSFPMLPQYWNGDRQIVSSQKTRLTKAVRAWTQKMETLFTYPMGQNYDITQAREIIGVVATPGPVFTDDPKALELLRPNLLRASSYSEIARWLSTG